MTNAVRGEQRLTIKGVEYLLRPENHALATIEGRLDVGLLDLVNRFLTGKPRVSDIAVVLHECSRAAATSKDAAALDYAAAFDFTLDDFAGANRCAMALLLERWGSQKGGSSGKESATAS